MLVSALNLTGDVKMKYEYLKGSEKDFEGAPEWAALKTEIDTRLFWLEERDIGYLSKPLGGIIASKISKLPDNEKIIAERRPITEPSWDGVGLPPVGYECEYTKESLPGNEWTECTIDYIGLSFAVYRDCYGVELTGIIGDIKFRPIRSEEDKKRDAVIEFITCSIDSHGVDPLNSAKFIYDAIAAGKIPGVKLEG